MYALMSKTVHFKNLRLMNYGGLLWKLHVAKFNIPDENLFNNV